MIGKVHFIACFWIGGAALFHYRNRKIMKMFMKISLEICEYFGAMFFAFVNAISGPTTELIKIMNAVSPYVVRWLFDTTVAVRWFCEQIISGLLGCNSIWISILSWIFCLSVALLCIAHKLSIQNPETERVREEEIIYRGDGDGAWTQNMQNDTRGNFRTAEIDRTASPLNVTAGNRHENGTLSGSVLDNSFKDVKLCIICYQREKNTAIFPCGHAHLCWKCACQIHKDRSKCPLCQQTIVELKKVYM